MNLAVAQMNPWLFVVQFICLVCLWDSLRPVFDATLRLKKPLIYFWLLLLVLSTGLAATV